MSKSEASIRVLLVDDEPELSVVTATFLEQEGYRFDVETASSASDGLACLGDEEFDCVVSDYDMPGTDGIEFLAAVRETSPDLPFILYTGKGSEEIASEAISAGVTDYLQKGTGNQQYELLANRIENAVAQSRAERRLEHSRQRLKEVTDASADLLFMFSHEWEDLLFFTETPQARSYEKLYGRPFEELEANPRAFLDAVHPDDREDVREAMRRTSKGSSVDVEYRVNEAEGYGTWLWSQTEPVFDDEGQVVRVVGFVRDITDRKERERELERVTEEYEVVFDAVTDGLALIDVQRDGGDIEFEIRQLNAAHEAVSGLSSAEVRGQSPRAALGAETWEQIATHYRRCVETQQPVSYEEVLDLPAGRVHWGTELRPVITDGWVTQLVGLARDISEQD